MPSQIAVSCRAADVERGTHLTVAHEIGVEMDDGKYHGNEGSHARKGIDLWKVQVSLRVLHWARTQ
jgi:hypothetical protein